MRSLPLFLVGLLATSAPPATAAVAASPDSTFDREVYAMGTSLGLHLKGPRQQAVSASEAAVSEVARIEAATSTWRLDSELSRLNNSHGKPVSLSPELLSLLGEAVRWQQETHGAFDPVLASLMRAWAIREGGGRTPSPEALSEARASAGAKWLRLDASHHTAQLLRSGAGIDEGGFVKGYALDRAEAALKSKGVTSGLLDFGGQLLAFGEPQMVAIADPKDRHQAELSLRLDSASLSTSGTSEHGRHILDPATGTPSPAWGAVSVVREDGLSADALSTALYVMGPKDGLAWADAHQVAAIFLPNEGAPLMSSAFRPLVAQSGPTSAGAPMGEGTPAVVDGGTTVTEERLQELERRVDVLSRALESQATAPIQQPAAPVEVVVPQTGLGPAASKVYQVGSGLSIGGYGETLFTKYASHLQNGTYAPQDAMTDTLRAVLYVGYKFTDWLVFNSEAEWEHSGVSDEHAQGEAIVEFAYLDFLLSRYANIRAGQVLLPVGFINELHEPPIFLGALRPFLEQENRIIPTTWHENGVGLFGELPYNLTYKLYVVNGLNASNFNNDGSGSIGGGRQDGHQAIANKPAVTGRLDFRPVPGVLLGGSFYTGDSAQERGQAPLWTTLLEAHAEYRGYGIQLRAIYARLTNEESGVAAFGPASPVFNTGTLQSGGYVEAGYDVFSLLRAGAFAHQSLIPFLRYEHVDTQQEVAAGAMRSGANSQDRIEVGANYKPIPQVAVKGDYDFVMDASSTGQNQFNVSLGYLF
jgi:thiamine biosynthesis lipoprotein ApbE